MSQLTGKQVAFLLTVIAVAFPPFTLRHNAGHIMEVTGWHFVGSSEGITRQYEKINILVLGLEVALIWGGYLVFRNSKRDENDTA